MTMDLPYKISIATLGLPMRKDGKFLLSQRHSPQHPLYDQKWQVIGGGLEYGEQATQALAREFQEEIQCSIDILWPYPIVYTTTVNAKAANDDHHSHVVLLVYLISIGNQTPDVSEDEETKDVGWYSLDEIMKLDCLPNTRESVLEAQKIAQTYQILK